jgi:hypothetical protein
MAGKHDVYIYKSDGEYRVRPAVTMFSGSAPGHLTPVRIRNLVNHDVLLVFPGGCVAASGEAARRPDRVVPGTPDTVVVAANSGATLSLNVGLDGRYMFQALILKDKDVIAAVGESGPSMIIDP